MTGAQARLQDGFWARRLCFGYRAVITRVLSNYNFYSVFIIQWIARLFISLSMSVENLQVLGALIEIIPSHT